MSSFVRAVAIRRDEPDASREAKRNGNVCGCTPATFELQTGLSTVLAATAAVQTRPAVPDQQAKRDRRLILQFHTSDSNTSGFQSIGFHTTTVPRKRREQTQAAPQPLLITITVNDGVSPLSGRRIVLME